jgi:hypothetical protein
MESSGKSERHFTVRMEKEHRLLEGSQASSLVLLIRVEEK